MQDLVGKKFGKLTVLKRMDKIKNSSVVWLCKCDCGNTKEVTTRDLCNNRVKSCGCSKGSSKSIVHKRFGKLTVIGDSGEKQGTSKIWICECDCGNTIKVRTDSLTSGRTISCGCSLYDQDKIKKLNDGKEIVDHTSMNFFKGTVSKNSITGINGVTKLKNGYYRAYIGYKRKVYVLYQGPDLECAKIAREEAEQLVKEGGFDEWINKKKKESAN